MSGSPVDPLVVLSARIEQLATDPGEVRLRWVRLASPVLRLVGWQPKFRVEAAKALIAKLQIASTSSARGAKKAKRGASSGSKDMPAKAAALGLPKLLEAAIQELDANVVSAERACVVQGRVAVSRAAWLRRLYEVVARAARAAQGAGDEEERRVAAAVDPVMLLPPLTPARLEGSGASKSEGRAEGQAPRPAPEIADDDERLIDLHLSAIDHLLDASRAETEFLGRRRRLLEAARKLLLDSAAALPLDPEGVTARRRHIAEQILRINRIEAAGISAEIGLLHQAKAALSRGDRQRLTAALGAMDAALVSQGDATMAAKTGEALRGLWKGRDASGRTARRASLERSTTEMLGATAVETIRRAYAEGREEFSATYYRKLSAVEREAKKGLLTYFKAGGEQATLSAALAVDGCFDVGGVLSPVRVEETETRVRAVAHPTQDLMLVPARDVLDIPSALIDDPRRVLLSLAEGRLLTRKFIERETIVRRRTKLVGEARIYLLDGSSSMLSDGRPGETRTFGARARMRDAILLAELATLRQRYLEHGKRIRVVLHYRYFTRVLWPTTRVDSASGAEAAMAEVIRTPREGGTDIEGALLASFEQVREARTADPELGRAQIVVITDGDAPVREEVIRKAREGAGDVPVAVSVIALGEENASLRAMVARQRARGERAFYHFIPDDELSVLVGGDADRGAAVHLDAVPSDDVTRPASEVAEELGREVGSLLDELSSLSERRHAALLDSAREEARAEAQALEEVGLSGASGAPLVSEGEKARREALDRDERALLARFSRWFPMAKGEASQSAEEALPAAGTPERDDFDAVMIALSTVTEVVSEVGGGRLSRRADAIEVLERLLPDARLSPGRYLGVLRAYPAGVEPALRAVRAAVG